MSFSDYCFLSLARPFICSTFVITLFNLDTNLAQAQATCTSIVSFSVEREDKTTNEVFFGELKAQGPDEVSVKPKLEAETLKAKARALDRCRSHYENSAGCLQAKLVSSASALQSASFTARKALEEALLSDCKKQQGLCKGSQASEIKCTVIEPTAAPDVKGSDAAKKGEKGKK